MPAQHHAGQPPVGDADGLQSAELLQVFQRKQIKSLTATTVPTIRAIVMVIPKFTGMPVFFK